MHFLKRIFFLFFLLFFQFSKAQVQFSPATLRFLEEYKENSSASFLKKDISEYLNNKYDLIYENDQLFIGSIIACKNPEKAKADLLTLGIQINSEVNDIFTANIPRKAFSALRKLSSIQYVGVGEKMALDMWETRKETGAEQVQMGTNLPHAFKGKDVVVGVIDIGYDFTHPNFYDSAGTELRIKAVWDQEERNAVQRPGGFKYGGFYDTEASILLKAFDKIGNDIKEFHGTHTTGIAAGSGFGTENLKYRGIAPNADLVLVSSSLSSNKVIDATKFIFDYAKKLGKPAVINMSFGFWSGPQDETNYYSKALFQLTGAGKIIVSAMGNEGAIKGHLKQKINLGDTLKTMLDLLNEKGNNKRPTYLECWGQPGQTFTMQLVFMDEKGAIRKRSKIFLNDKPESKDSSIIGKSSVVFTGYKNFSSNNRPFAEFEIRTEETTLKPVLFVFPSSESQEVSVYTPFINLINRYSASSPILKGFLMGDSLASGRSPAISKNIIGVGAYVDKNAVFGISGVTLPIPTAETQFTVGQFAPFSSRGPDLNGSSKPNIVAPGVVLVSSYNSFLNQDSAGKTDTDNASEAFFRFKNRNYRWVFASGTSMACPVVVGIVALMLEKNPFLTQKEVLSLLENSVREDVFTGNLSDGLNNSWGRGKISAIKAIENTIGFAEKSLPKVFPNYLENTLEIVNLESFGPNDMIQIIDASGKLCFSILKGSKQELELDIHVLPRGVYFLRINGKTQKFFTKLLKLQ